MKTVHSYRCEYNQIGKFISKSHITWSEIQSECQKAQMRVMNYTYWFHVHVKLHVHIDLIKWVVLSKFSFDCYMVCNFPTSEKKLV